MNQPTEQLEQPNSELRGSVDDLAGQISDLRGSVDSLSEDVHRVDRKVLSRSDVEALVSERLVQSLRDYSTTQQIQQIVGDVMAGLNREMKTGFGTISGQFQTYMQTVNQRLADHQSTIDSHSDEFLLFRERQTQLESALGKIEHTQTASTRLLQRIDNNIRGDGINAGLVGRMNKVEDKLPTLESSFMQAMQGIQENSRLLRETQERELERERLKALQDKRRRDLMEHVKESAKFVVSRGIGWGLGTGMLGTVALEILKIL